MKRSNLNIYDEAGFALEDLFVTSMPFITQDSNFKLDPNADKVNVKLNAKNVPNQAIFTSSASDMSTYFYQKAYKDYAKKMLLGDRDYFVADVNATVVFNAKYNGKIYPVSLLSKKEVDDALRNNKEKALREYFNEFSIDGGDKQPFKLAQMKKNSEVRVPELKNVNNKRYVIAYDPARQKDNSMAFVGELYDDPKIGYKMRIVAGVSFVDIGTKKKIPMQYPEQIKYIKKMVVDFNGLGKQDYENIECLMIDSGAGGGGRFIADTLMDNWVDKNRVPHKGLIDKIEHVEYLKNFPEAINKLKLMGFKKYKVEMYDALTEMINLDLISFTEEYDGKGYIMIPVDTDLDESYEYEDEDGEIITVKKNREMYKHELTFEEELSLIRIEKAKDELSTMWMYDVGTTDVRYDLRADKKNTGDDSADCMAMLGWYLQQKRRGQILDKPKVANTSADMMRFRKPQPYGVRGKSSLYRK